MSPTPPETDLAALIGEVRRDAPDALGQTLDDAGPAQGFQSAHVSPHDLAWVTGDRGLFLGDGQVMLCSVDAIDCERRDGPVGRSGTGRPADLDHHSHRVLFELRFGRKRDVVRLTVSAIDDQVATVV